jgi:flagellar hook-associated protein 3 FlgL
MRVSTAQFYFQNAQQISNKSSDVNNQVEYISSGKRILTAKDDAVSFGTLSGYKEDMVNIDKYKRNIIQAENRNTLLETSFTTAEGVMQELKQLFIQANNGTLSDSDLSALADIAKNSQSQLLDVANSKDETGSYIFSGFQVETEPFSLQINNTVNYNGDSGRRELQIGKNINVELNQPGDQAFENVANPMGDFVPTYLTNAGGIAVDSAVVANPSSYDELGFPPNYTFTFSAPGDLTVTDNNGVAVYPTSPYTPGQTVAFNGIEVKIGGNPLPGDQLEISPAKTISIFDIIKSAIDWMNVGTTPANPSQHSNDYSAILSQLDEALDHMTSGRSQAGVRLSLIESQQNNHLDQELSIAKGSSNIEDLDFAKAISTFEKSKVALQAAQQTFMQIKDLSLFNYI